MAWKDGETISPLGLNRIEEAVASMNESYTPTVWEVGDLITAEKLNKIEEGIAGVQPSGKKEITSTAEVNVASYATAQVVDEDLVAGNIKKDVDILGVVGSYEGGGASDFSTAEVKVINTTADLVSVSAVSIRDTPSSAIAAFGTIMADSDRTYTAPLYKGVCTWKITAADAAVAVTGDISYDNGNIFITGDGTITIS